MSTPIQAIPEPEGVRKPSAPVRVGDSMLSTTSVLLGIALVWLPMASNVSSAPPWETLPAEQPLSAMAVEGYIDHMELGSGTERPVRASQLSYCTEEWRAV